MGKVQKINFPYFIDRSKPLLPREKRMVIFFGTDFYNLPLDSNRENYIIATNKMLDYIRKYFAGLRLIYQAHPNEKEELEHLDLSGFTIGDRKVAEVFLYENANSIEYVFSTCSWANGSAFAMGINSAVFLDLLKGSISDESILAYHSYFEGLPKSFFITSFDEIPPARNHADFVSSDDLLKIIESVNAARTVWILATDPALALRGAIIGYALKKKSPEIKLNLLIISNRRWANVQESQKLFSVFDDVHEFPHERVTYTMRWKSIKGAFEVARAMKKLPIKDGDALISFCHILFEENCLLSYYPNLRKILFIESRWYFFTYEGQHREIADNAFRALKGVLFFNLILSPILRTYKIIFRELRDGKVLNIFRYKKPLEEVYDHSFVIMP